MTTEIAVLNRLGVALAADSAVTISGGGTTKVFDSADKLFELSCIHPVAIMLNGNMDCLGVPWEIIIKDFRELHGAEAREGIQKWVSDFVDYIGSRADLGDNAAQRYVEQVASDELIYLRDRVSEKLWKDKAVFARDAKDVIPPLIKEVVSKRREYIASIRAAKTLENLSLDELLVKYEVSLNAIIDATLTPSPLPEDVKQDIRQLIVEAMRALLPSPHSTGLIVAGYGKNENYPSVTSVDILGYVNGYLKYSEIEQKAKIEKPELGYAVSFAQRDVIERLLGGADPRFIKKTSDFLAKVAEKLSPIIVDALIENSSDEHKSREAQRVGKVLEVIRDLYITKTSRSFLAEFRDEYETMIALMPKLELIELAEALISITAIEHKATSDEGTVGGPVDVAFITKHEGFVWIKRKHYFKPDLNPRYFWRKYQRTQKELEQ